MKEGKEGSGCGGDLHTVSEEGGGGGVKERRKGGGWMRWGPTQLLLQAAKAERVATPPELPWLQRQAIGVVRRMAVVRREMGAIFEGIM